MLPHEQARALEVKSEQNKAIIIWNKSAMRKLSKHQISKALFMKLYASLEAECEMAICI